MMASSIPVALMDFGWVVEPVHFCEFSAGVDTLSCSEAKSG